MSDNTLGPRLMSDPDVVIAAWLDDGPTEIPDSSRRAFTAALSITPQRRRALGAPWRSQTMNLATKLTVTAAAAVVIVAGGLMILSPRPSGPGEPRPTVPPPSPTPGVSSTPSAPATPVPSAAPLPDTSEWIAYTSDRYGYSAAHPAEWELDLGGRSWTVGDELLPEGDNVDVAVSPLYDQLIGTSVARRPGASDDEWLDAYWAPALASGQHPSCIPDRETWDTVAVDGRPGFVYAGCGYVEAVVLLEERVYVFAIVDPLFVGRSADAIEPVRRPLLEAYLSTVTLRPNEADDSAPVPS